MGAFMADLVTDPAVWAQWQDSAPHILDVPKTPADAPPGGEVKKE